MEPHTETNTISTKMTAIHQDQQNTVDAADLYTESKSSFLQILNAGLHSFLLSITRRYVFAFIVLGSIIIVGASYILSRQPIYQAVMTIKFHPSISAISKLIANESEPVTAAIDPLYLQSQSEILANPAFIVKTLEKFSDEELKLLTVNNANQLNIFFELKEKYKQLLGHIPKLTLLHDKTYSTHVNDYTSAIKVQVFPQQSSIKMTVFSANADFAVHVSDLLVKDYSALRTQQKQKEAYHIQQEVDLISNTVNIETSKKISEIETFQKKYQVIPPEDYQKSILQLEDAVANYKSSLNNLRAHKTKLRGNDPLGVDEKVDQLVLLKKGMETLYQQKIVDLKPKHPEMLKLDEQIKDINNKINILRTKSDKNIKDQISLFEKKILNAQSKINQLILLKDDNMERYIQLSKLQEELSFLEDQNKMTREYASNVMNLQAIDFPLVTYEMLSAPTVITDTSDVMPSIYRLVFLGGIFTLALMILLHIRGIVYRNSQDIEEIHNTPVLDDVVSDHMLSFRESKKSLDASLCSDIYNDFKKLANSIFYSNDSGPPKVICCTSVVNGEDDWISATGLAITYAKQNRQVLLIDTCLNQPTINDVFNITNHYGLTNILVTGDSPINCTQQSNIQNLHIIPSGPRSGNPSLLLNGVKMKEFLMNAKDAFDIVILNAPAIKPKSDMLGLSKLSDVIIVSTFSGNTRQHVLASAFRKLKSFNIRPLGVVFYKKMSIGDKIWKKTQQLNENLKLIKDKNNDG